MIYQRDIFVSGAYVEHFAPDQAYNPFHSIYAMKRKRVLASVGSALAPGSTVLDIGGGMGRMAVPLARQYTVTLCDISVDMLRLAQEAADKDRAAREHLTTYCLNAAEPLPFPAARFDGILAIDLLVHLPDPVATLRELRRVLKPGGDLLVDMTNSRSAWILGYPGYVGRRPHRWIQTWIGGGVLPEWQGIVRHYAHREFSSMLDMAGFRSVEEWRFGPWWCAKWFLMRCR